MVETNHTAINECKRGIILITRRHSETVYLHQLVIKSVFIGRRAIGRHAIGRRAIGRCAIGRLAIGRRAIGRRAIPLTRLAPRMSFGPSIHGHSKYGLETQLKSSFYLFVRLYVILYTVTDEELSNSSVWV